MAGRTDFSSTTGAWQLEPQARKVLADDGRRRDNANAHRNTDGENPSHKVTLVKPWIVPAAIVAARGSGSSPDASAAQGFPRCESKGYRHEYCAANTQGRVVLLREISTGNLCRAT